MSDEFLQAQFSKGEFQADSQEAPSELAVLDHFLRLHQSQWEFLAWLNATEAKCNVGRETYRKIR